MRAHLLIEVNGVFEGYLRNYVSPTQDDWNELPQVEFSMNNDCQESVSDILLIIGFCHHLRLCTSLHQIGGRDVWVSQANQFVNSREENLACIKASLLAARSCQKMLFDQRRREVEYPMEQQVLLSTVQFKLANPETRELLPKSVGPFEVVEWSGQIAYKVRLSTNVRCIMSSTNNCLSHIRMMDGSNRHHLIVKSMSHLNMSKNKYWITAKKSGKDKLRRSS
jgi:hypothetical protein